MKDEECDHALGIENDYDSYTMVYQSYGKQYKKLIDREFNFCPDCGKKLEKELDN